MIQRLYTIGVYGKTEEEFLQALAAAGIQTFCDIRRRRGIRGSQYAFANSIRLQQVMASRAIEYRYFKELAPSNELRKAQRALDTQQGVQKRKRQELSDDFKRRYAAETLSAFDAQQFAGQFGSEISSIVLFCVEANPAACHRSLVAERLQKDWGVTVEHL
jgi:uncharacterized protein (DUF488 family)